MEKIITIVGTNASGKSAVGIKLAKEFNGEIISADSRQIFRGFDLCCGKVTAEESSGVIHHMIDLIDVGTPFSVADYQEHAQIIIDDIIKRRRLPFIVGGTGLYINSVIYQYQFDKEEIDLEYRMFLENKQLIELQEMLPNFIIEYLNPSDYNNKRRLIRILEKIRNGNNPLPKRNESMDKYDVLQIGITWPRDLLDKRIDERLNRRIEQGMIDEVRDYLNNGGNPDVMYKLGLEYRYIMWYLTGKYTSLKDFTEAMSTAIKQFSKRQMKWFKRDKSIHWINMECDYLGEARSLIQAFL